MTSFIQFLGRLHPMVLHLPIGLITGLIALEAIGFFRRKPVAREVTLLMSWLVALSGVAAAVSGFVLSYEGDFSGPTLDRHLVLGIAFAVAALLSAVLLSRGAVGAYRGLLLLSAALMFPAGHLGASMTHGEDFLTAPFDTSVRPEQKGAVEPISEGTVIHTSSVAATDAEFAPVGEFLTKYCVECHGPDRTKGRLRLDSLAGLQKGGKSGPGFIAGNPAESTVIERLHRPLDEDGHMPPESRDQPGESEIQVLEKWISKQAANPLAATASAPHDVVEVLNDPPAVEAQTPKIPPVAAEKLDALKQHLVHVEPIESGSNLLSLDFGAVAKSLGDEQARALILSVREQIASLSLARMSLSDATATAIGTLPNLRKLDLRGSGIGDPAVAALQESSIEELNLAQTRVSDAAVDVLSAMKSLKRVFLWKSGLSLEGVARLAAARPDLQITTGSEADAESLESEGTLAYSSDAPIPGQPATPPSLKPINAKCPVTGSPVDPRYAIVHEGRVIGFCCEKCPKEFWSDPKKFEVKSE